ncbi:50S ribosomal protein L17 [Patescibacteria group bacterium]|nr:50S ribosomal protein L17 [Patescibacteria group bacterium]
MRHRNKIKILDRKKAPRESLLNNLACQLILYEKITTTLAKAKVLRPRAEKLVTRAKQDTVANRRLILAKLPVKKAVKKLFEVIGPRYKERAGGYVRITKTGVRKGDGALMAVIEFV